MSDLGADIAGQVMPTTIKFFEFIGKFFSSAYDQTLGKSAQDRQAAKHVRNEYRYQEKLRELSGNTGHVDYNRLKNSGVPLDYTGLENVTEAQYQNIKEVCKKHDLLCSAITDSDGTYIIMCKKDERELFLKIVDNELLQQKVGVIDNTIESVRKDFENGKINENEMSNAVNSLNSQRSEVVSETNNAENSERWGKNAATILKGEKNVGCSKSFNEAIMWNTDNLANLQTEPFYIVDALNPNKYIECSSYTYTDISGKEKVGTDFAVHGSKNGEILTATDRNYNAIKAKDWFPKHFYPMLDTMKAHSNFSNCVFKIQNKEDYLKFMSMHIAATKNLKEFDFDVLQPDLTAKYLEVQLINNGYELNESGYVLRSDTKERIDVLASNTIDDFHVTIDNYKDVEALIIGKQINAYHTHHAALKNAERLKGNDEAYNALITELNNVESRYELERNFLASKTAEFESRDSVRIRELKNKNSQIDEASLFTKKDVLNSVNKNASINELIKEAKARTGMVNHARSEIGGLAR